MKKNDRGFTLVEILVGLAVSSIAMSAIYSTYMSQQKTYVAQQEMAIMQQNLRAAMYLVTREARMAGYDPTGNADAGIVTAGTYVDANNQAEINFTLDDNGDGDTGDSGEDLTYSLYTSGGIQKLGRKNPTTNMPIAEHIERFHVFYLDAANAVTATLSNIRSVQITIVGRTSKIEGGYNAGFSYQDLQGNTYNIAGDGYRRAALSMQVQCRNMGLE